MKTSVQKWGNSLAVRIPKSFAIEVGLGQDSPVEISLVSGKLVVEPLQEPVYRLDDLLAGVTAENLHQEVDTGSAVGNEAW
jgi:antitoxin MazE